MNPEITIDEEFRSLIPPLTPEEAVGLEFSLIQEGCRDALATWGGILLDGHNRFEICRRHGLPFETREIQLPERDAAEDWIDANQLGRRNLPPHAKFFDLAFVREGLTRRNVVCHRMRVPDSRMT